MHGTVVALLVERGPLPVVASLLWYRVGSLDEPARLPPDIHIFTSSKQPWVVLPPGARAVPEFYKPSELWPAESRERFAALRKQ